MDIHGFQALFRSFKCFDGLQNLCAFVPLRLNFFT